MRFRTTIAAVSLSALLLALVPLSASAAAAMRPNPKTPRATAQDTAGFSRLDPAPPTGLTAEQIIAKFGERESAFARARDQYTFRQTVKIETLNQDTSKPTGAYNQVSDITFDDKDRRAEHVTFAPANSLVDVMLSESDFDDIAHRLPFVLTTEDLPQYDVTYVGRQKVDDLNTYVFDAAPKTLVKNHRYFQGRIWVDQQDLQIVLINGKTVPQDTRRGHEDLSPPYTTYYSEVDGNFWFPVYTHADGILHFAGGTGYLAQDVRLRYTVKYEDYKRFRAKSRIIYNGAELPPAEKGTPAPSVPVPATPDPNAKEDNSKPPVDPNAPPLSRPKP